MIYNQPNITTATGLSDRQASFSRPINFCESQTAKFLGSRCKHSDPSLPAHNRASLQDYFITCHEEEPEQDPRRPLAEIACAVSRYNSTRVGPDYRVLGNDAPGRCAQEEICIDGQGRGRIAFCVSTEYFVRMIMRGDRQDGEKVGGLEGKTAQIIVSHSDESTPMRVQGMDLTAGVTGNVNAGASVVQEQKCQHCFELGTQNFGEGTDFLQREASLMAATTVAAGVVFLVVSG